MIRIVDFINQIYQLLNRIALKIYKLMKVLKRNICKWKIPPWNDGNKKIYKKYFLKKLKCQYTISSE